RHGRILSGAADDEGCRPRGPEHVRELPRAGDAVTPRTAGVARLRGDPAGGTVPDGTYAPQTMQAAELMLAAIALGRDTRLGAPRTAQTPRPGRCAGAVPLRCHRECDPRAVTVFGITGRTPRSSNLVSDFRGSVPLRVVSI